MKNGMCKTEIKVADAYYKEGYLFFINDGTKNLIRYNLQEKKIDSIQGLPIVRTINVKRVLEDDGFIYFVSSRGARICRGRCENKSVIIDCDMEYGFSEVIVKDAFIIDQKIFIISINGADKIITFDIVNNSFDEIDSMEERFSQNIGRIWNVRCKGDKLFFVVENSSSLYEIDLKNSLSNQYSTKIKEDLVAFVFDKENVWFRVKEGYKLYKWNMQSGELKKFELDSLAEDEKEEMSLKLDWMNSRYLLLLPAKTNTIAYFDGVKLNRLAINQSIKRRENTVYTLNVVDSGESLVILPWSIDVFVEINKNTLMAEIGYTTLTKKQECYVEAMRWNEQIIRLENEKCTLKNALDVFKSEFWSQKETQNNQFIGTTIYREI